MSTSVVPHGKDQNIRVCVRVRPVSEEEAASGLRVVWVAEGTRSIRELETWGPPPPARTNGQPTNSRRPRAFTLDRVFDGEASNEAVYEEFCEPIVADAMRGYHGAILAYGQTATGKTYSMQGTPRSPGIMPRAIEDVFASIESETGAQAPREYALRVSYLEVYNETLHDLLRPDGDGAALRLVDDPKTGATRVAGAVEERVASIGDVFDAVVRGEALRRVGETRANARSSRSHAVLRLTVESRASASGQTQQQKINNLQQAARFNGSRFRRRESGGPEFRGAASSSASSSSPSPLRSSSSSSGALVATLSFCDLAGSERASGAFKDRDKEGGYINRSLHALAHVVAKLAAQQLGHVPYRDSKLTRLLRPALGGNARVALVCTCSAVDVDETANTLQFASRAKRVVQVATRNTVLDAETQLAAYKQQVLDLKQRLAALEQEKRASASPDVGVGVVEAVSASSSGFDGPRSARGGDKPAVHAPLQSVTPPGSGSAVAGKGKNALAADRMAVARDAIGTDERKTLAAAVEHLERLILRSGRPAVSPTRPEKQPPTVETPSFAEETAPVGRGSESDAVVEPRRASENASSFGGEDKNAPAESPRLAPSEKKPNDADTTKATLEPRFFSSSATRQRRTRRSRDCHRRSMTLPPRPLEGPDDRAAALRDLEGLLHHGAVLMASTSPAPTPTAPLRAPSPGPAGCGDPAHSQKNNNTSSNNGLAADDRPGDASKLTTPNGSGGVVMPPPPPTTNPRTPSLERVVEETPEDDAVSPTRPPTALPVALDTDDIDTVAPQLLRIKEAIEQVLARGPDGAAPPPPPPPDPARDQECQELRQALVKARDDAAFLLQQLDASEEENKRLRDQLRHLSDVVKSRETELLQLKGVTRDEETF